MSRPTRGRWFALRIRGYHPLWPAFPDGSACLTIATGLVRVRSPLLAESLLMSFPTGTEMFQFPAFASFSYFIQKKIPCIDAWKRQRPNCSGRSPSPSTQGGFPHSEIHGSKGIRTSPWLIAAYHVLLRLCMPRHPPIALKTLDHSHCQCPPQERRDQQKRPASRDLSGGLRLSSQSGAAG